MATLRQPQIPGIDIGERRMTSADARLFARDPGPGNPRVGPGGSPEARAFQPPPRPASVAGMDAVERPMSSAEARQFRVPGTPTVSPAQRAGQFLRDAGRTALGHEVAQGPQRPVGAAGRALRMGGTALGAGGVALGSLIEDAPKVLSKVRDPNATGLDVGAAVSGAAGKAAATTAGALSGAKLGAAAGSFLGPIGTLAGGFIGGGAGAYLANRGANVLVEPSLRASGPTAAPAAAPTPAPAPAPLGMTGAGTDAKKLTGDFDRSPSQDLTPALNTVSRDMPAGMARGMIYKTIDANGRPVYSGFDVGNDAQMVDGKGQQLRSGGTLSVVGGMAPGEAQAILARPMPGQGQGGPVNLTAQGGLFDTPRARRQAEALRLEQRGQDLNFSATTRGQDMSLKGVMAGVQERRDARAQELAISQGQRLRQGAYVQQANGDMAKAANAAMAAGDTAIAEALSGAADKSDARATKRNEVLTDLLKPLSTSVDKDGKGYVDEAKLQQNTAALQGLAESMNIPVEELMADAASARAAVKLLKGINERSAGFTDRLGLTTPTLRTQFPDMRQAQTERVGIREGILPLDQPRIGDRKIVTSSGPLYIPEDVWADEDVQNLIKSRINAPKK